jgi:hypothetical protein
MMISSNVHISRALASAIDAIVTRYHAGHFCIDDDGLITHHSTTTLSPPSSEATITYVRGEGGFWFSSEPIVVDRLCIRDQFLPVFTINGYFKVMPIDDDTYRAVYEPCQTRIVGHEDAQGVCVKLRDAGIGEVLFTKKRSEDDDAYWMFMATVLASIMRCTSFDLRALVFGNGIPRGMSPSMIEALENRCCPEMLSAEIINRTTRGA